MPHPARLSRRYLPISHSLDFGSAKPRQFLSRNGLPGPLFTRQTLTEHLLCPRPCNGCWVLGAVLIPRAPEGHSQIGRHTGNRYSDTILGTQATTGRPSWPGGSSQKKLRSLFKSLLRFQFNLFRAVDSPLRRETRILDFLTHL